MSHLPQSHLHVRSPSPQPPPVASTSQAQPGQPRPSTPRSRLPPNLPLPIGGGSREQADHRRMTHVLDALRITSRMAADPAKDSGIPGLGVVLSTIAKVLEKLQAMQATVKGVATLLERINSLLNLISCYYSRPHGQQLPENMRRRMDGLAEKWLDIAKRAHRIKEHRFFTRFLASDDDVKLLEGLVREISTSIQDDFLLGGILDIEGNLHAMQQDVDNVREDVGLANQEIRNVGGNVEQVLETVERIQVDQRAIQVNLEASFLSGYAKKARYDAGDVVRRPCLDGTRMDLLDDFRDWITKACTRKDSPEARGSVLYISGLAGTGKTTIACSIAEWADQQGLLAGSFFCSRFDPECNNPTLVFVTVARQLCSFHKPFRDKVAEALQKNPGVAGSGAANQFEKLIVEPLEALEEPFPPCLLVFDALDECRNEASDFIDGPSTIVAVVAKFMSRVEQFLTFLFTSRPEPSVTRLFNGPPAETLAGVTRPVVLHMIELKLVEGDIRRYLVDGFRRISAAYRVPPDWPSPQDVDKLVSMARGLFIFVATALKFIMDKAYRNPPKQLQRIFNIGAASDPSTTILNTLYSGIIAASYDEISSGLAEGLQKVLGAIAPAQEPLSTSTLASLLGLCMDDVTNTLSGLHSVLHIPDDPNEPILVIHPTFPEFLLRTREATAAASVPPPIEFYISAQQHWFLFSRCLAAVSTLKRDIASVRYPAKFKSEIDDLSERVRSAVPPHVRYACECWSFHFRRAAVRSEEVDGSRQLYIFMYEGLLPWIEACILLNIPTPPLLDAASNACRTLGGAFSDLVPLLADCRRFVQTHSSIMHTAPLQLYHFALSIAPANSPLRALYSRELDHSIVVCRGAPSHWPPCLDTIVAHRGGKVYSVTFSADGSCFASGGGDKQVRIWDSATRTELRSFDEHTGDVVCVAFSPDGEYVAWGSDDGAACIWHVSTGNRIHTLEHTGPVFSVAYSADGGRILSATDEGEVKLWDTADGRCVFTLEKTGTYTWQAALSPDGNVIACGQGASLALHDVSSATTETLDLPDEVEACAFSPDGHYVAARTEHAIRVWATADKALVRSIDMPDSDLMSRLAFSRDGEYIVCGFESGAVYVWQVTSEDPPHTLNGHTSMVQDIAWTTDGLQLASASSDHTVRLWDGALHPAVIDVSSTSEHQLVLPGAAGPPLFALVRYKGYSALLDLPSLGIEHFPVDPRSPEGAPVVAAFTDVVAACDAACQHFYNSSPSARNWAFLTGQQSVKLGRRPVAISRDGSLMAYLSPTSAKSVDICNVHTGAVVATLQGHTDIVYSIVFSPDGTRLATGSFDNTVKVWDATTGVPVCSHAEHQGSVHATAFSTDGCFVASGSDDGTVCIFEVATGRVVHVLGPTNHWVIQVAFTMDNQHVIGLDPFDKVVVWDAASGARIHSFDDKDWRLSLMFSSNTLSIRVPGDAGNRIIVLRKTTTRLVNFYKSDGWLYAWSLGATHRLCGLPAEWRTVMGSYGDLVYLREAKSDAHPDGRDIVLDMSHILAYVESLVPDNS